MDIWLYPQFPFDCEPQTQFRLVAHNQKLYCQYDHIPFNFWKKTGIYSYRGVSNFLSNWRDSVIILHMHNNNRVIYAYMLCACDPVDRMTVHIHIHNAIHILHTNSHQNITALKACPTTGRFVMTPVLLQPSKKALNKLTRHVLFSSLHTFSTLHSSPFTAIKESA